MKRYLMLGAIAALAMGMGSPAPEVTGRVRSINQFANTATLDSGDSFFLGTAIDVGSLRIGEMVKITYRGIGSSKRAITVTPLN